MIPLLIATFPIHSVLFLGYSRVFTSVSPPPLPFPLSPNLIFSLTDETLSEGMKDDGDEESAEDSVDFDDSDNYSNGEAPSKPSRARPNRASTSHDTHTSSVVSNRPARNRTPSVLLTIPEPPPAKKSVKKSTFSESATKKKADLDIDIQDAPTRSDGLVGFLCRDCSILITKPPWCDGRVYCHKCKRSMRVRKSCSHPPNLLIVYLFSTHTITILISPTPISVQILSTGCECNRDPSSPCPRDTSPTKSSSPSSKRPPPWLHALGQVFQLPTVARGACLRRGLSFPFPLLSLFYHSTNAMLMSSFLFLHFPSIFRVKPKSNVFVSESSESPSRGAGSQEETHDACTVHGHQRCWLGGRKRVSIRGIFRKILQQVQRQRFSQGCGSWCH